MTQQVRSGTFPAGATSFDTGLNETPVAILLVAAATGNSDGVQEDIQSSFGASDGTNQWAASFTCPFSTVDSPPDLTQEAFSSTKVVLIIDDTGAVDFDAAVDAFNADGTVDLTWTGAPVGDVGYTAWSDMDAVVGVVQLGSSAFVATPQTLSPGFEVKAVICANSLGHVNGGNHMGCWARGDPIGPTDDNAIGATIALRFLGGNVDVQDANRRLVDFRSGSGVATTWDVDGSSVTATDFDLIRTVNNLSTPATDVGYLAIGGCETIKAGATGAGTSPIPAVNASWIPLGGLTACDFRNVLDNDQRMLVWGSWDDQDHQWAMLLYGANAQNPPEECHVRRVYYNDRLNPYLESDGTVLTAYRTIDAVPNQFGDPVVTTTGTYGIRNHEGWVTWVVDAPISGADFVPQIYRRIPV